MDEEWREGTEMNDWLKERYYKICQARYRTISGECFGFAGILMIAGTSGAILSSQYRTIFIAVFAVLTAVFLITALTIRKQARLDLAFIPNGEFLWKYDEVQELLPDRYPDTCKIIAKSEKEPCVLLQPFWLFTKEGTFVCLVKCRKQAKRASKKMIVRFTQMDVKIQAFIA